MIRVRRLAPASVRRMLRCDGVALFIIGVIALSRLVTGAVPETSPDASMLDVSLLPSSLWGTIWALTAFSCFVAMKVPSFQPWAVGLSTFTLTSWGINWILTLMLAGGAVPPLTSYLLVASALGNWALVALLLWGLGRGKAGDAPDEVEIIDTLKEVTDGGARH